MSNKSGYKYLAKNVGLLTISNFATSFLGFFLIPLYTAVLTTAEYGIYDLISNTVSLLIPILTLNISESVMRFTLEKGADKKCILSTGLRILSIGSAIIFLALAVNSAFTIYAPLKEYGLFFWLIYVTSALQQIISCFARGLDKIRALAISGILGTAVHLVLNILFLLPLRMGLTGYFVSYILGQLVQAIYLGIEVKVWDYISFRKRDTVLSLRMTKYSKPLIANSVAWWVNSVSDRYIVTLFQGMAENGIYAMGGKIPSILNILVAIFNQAWSLSAIKDFDPEDKNHFFSNLYNSYEFVIIAGGSFIILIDRPLARFLYANSFYEAWRFVPFLTIAVVFGALSGYIGGIFVAVKDSKIFAESTVVGAISNFIMNVVLVYLIGALGAAIATAISYCIIWALRMHKVKQYINMKLYIVRDYTAFSVLVVQALALLIMPDDTWIAYIVQIAFLIVVFILFRNELWRTIALVRENVIDRIKCR